MSMYVFTYSMSGALNELPFKICSAEIQSKISLNSNSIIHIGYS